MAVSTGGATRQLVAFSIGDGEYAFPIEAVHEIVRYEPPRAVASDLPWHLGVMSLRGKVLPVLDLAVRLGARGAEGAERSIVIVDAGEEQAGIVVDAVEEVLDASEEQFEPLPASSDPVLRHIVNLGDRLVVLVDPAGVAG
jgi:purine-binding chemotaxis protein CheW